jgi:fructose-bisphosphate aldolase class II
MLISSEKLLQTARANHFAFPHFNFWNLDSLKAEIAVAEEFHLPVILAWAETHSKELTIYEAAELGKFYGQKAEVPVVLHLDHGTTPSLVIWGIDHGFTSVMIDASFKSFDENVAITKDIVRYAHKHGVPVEAEIGHVGTDIDTNDSSKYTEVEAAKEFYNKTRVDSLAVAIGTSHGVYKSGTPHINFERLKELQLAINIPLVLHGGSSSGDDNLSRAAQNGIAKINIFTDISVAALHAAQNKKYAMYFEMEDAERQAMKATVKHYYEVFGTLKYKEFTEENKNERD